MHWDVVPGYTRSRVKSLHTVHFSEIECRVCGRVARVGPARNMRAADKPLWKHQASMSIIPHISLDDADDEQLMRGDSETLFNSLIIF